MKKPSCISIITESIPDGLPEIVIDKNGVAKEFLAVERKDHFSNSMFYSPDEIIKKQFWLGDIDLLSGKRIIKKR